MAGPTISRLRRAELGGALTRDGPFEVTTTEGSVVFGVYDTPLITVVDYTSIIANDTITISYGSGLSLVLTAKVAASASGEFTIGGSNNATATNIVTTITNLASTYPFSASASGAVVTINGPATSITTSKPAAFNVSKGKIDMDGSDLVVDDLALESITVSSATKSSTISNVAIGLTTTTGLMDVNAGANLDVDATGTMALDSTTAANFTSSGGDVTVQATTKSVNIVGNEAATDAINIDSSAGGLDVDVSLDANITSTAGSVLLIGAEAVADAIRLQASNAAGGVDIDAGTGGITIDVTGAADIRLDSSAGSFYAEGAEAVADAIRLYASNAAGGIDIDAGTNGITIDSTGAFSFDGVTDSNLTISGVDAADKTLTVSCTGAAAGNARTVVITATNGGGGGAVVDVDAITVTIDGDAGGVSIDGAATSNFSTSAGDLDLSAFANLDLDGATVDMTSAGALNIDGTAVSLDGTISSNVTVTANAAGDQTLTVQCTNAGVGEGLVAINADYITHTGFTTVDELNSTRYYWKEDWDEEAAAITLDNGLRTDEWTEAGTNTAAAHFTYIQSIGGALQIVTAGADDDSDGAYHINTSVNTGANPIIEFRFQTDSVSSQQNGILVGVTETTGILDIHDIGGVSNDYLAVGMDSDLGTPASLRAFSNANAAGNIVRDLGVAISATTWATVRIDMTSPTAPRIWVNNTGGAISPDDEVVVDVAITFQDNIYVYPFVFVQGLDPGPSPSTLIVDYVKVWQDRV